jgi:SAM-dependent methyltransferase
MAATALLFGMEPAPVTQCRVLEVGCGDGSNLIPMAYHLPGSRFVGIDLADEPIAAGREMAAALQLGNIELRAADLRGIDASCGEFDYIIAHGVYSWIPVAIRDRLVGLCAERLTPRGVAFISYNTYPGRYPRHMLREMMLYHTRGAASDGERIQQARAFLEFLAKNQRTTNSLAPMLQDEVRTLLESRDFSLTHDDLAPVCDPVYFHEFAAHAAAHGLQFLGETDTHLMFDPAENAELASLGPLEREQYRDFLLLRRFRQTLLCHEGIELQRNPPLEAMDRLHFSSPAREVGGDIEGGHGVRIVNPQDAVRAVAGALRDVFPFPVSFEDLAPYAGQRQTLREILFALVRGGFAEIHAHDYPCEDSVSAKPMASRLARYQAARGRIVTSAAHAPVELDAPALRLLCLMDGERTHEDIARILAEEEGAPPAAELLGRLRAFMVWLAQMGLLEA